MQGSPKALPSLLPIGLGTEAGNFNTIYRDTFTRTVIRDENVHGAERAGCKARRSWTRRGGVLEARPAEQRALQGEMKAHEPPSPRRRPRRREHDGGGSAVLADPGRRLSDPLFRLADGRGFDLAFREEGHWTLGAFRTMVDDFRFEEALRTTLILIGVIIPLQFALALGMALLVSAHLRFRSIFLYIFLLPLAISDPPASSGPRSSPSGAT